ncbi:MAG: GGDEF domain-containing protein [Campylobacterales bacterium]|nr:GGDEF domain-containing protein [Campylobacterales bacterium]
MIRLHLHSLRTSQDFPHRYVAIKESIHERKRLETLASIDPLTKLYNRAHFNALMELELNRQQRSSLHASLILCDIDDFKKINDTYGHLFGDKALSYVAQTIAHSIRKHDVAARWGGEEFIILLPDTQLEQALHVAQKIRLALTHAEFQKTVTLTASFGVTQLRRNENATSWFHRTDEALYKAKQSGKNRVAH